MLDEYNLAAIELCGEEYDSEISYQVYEGKVSLYNVMILKKTHNAKDPTRWIRLDITDLLSEDQFRMLAQEVSQHLVSLWEENRVAA